MQLRTDSINNIKGYDEKNRKADQQEIMRLNELLQHSENSLYEMRELNRVANNVIEHLRDDVVERHVRIKSLDTQTKIAKEDAKKAKEKANSVDKKLSELTNFILKEADEMRNEIAEVVKEFEELERTNKEFYDEIDLEIKQNQIEKTKKEIETLQNLNNE